jgi:Flp pilus assembly pilin Flp
MNLIKFTRINERGVTMIEYALLLAAVVLVILVAFDVSGIATAIGTLIGDIITRLAPPA